MARFVKSKTIMPMKSPTDIQEMQPFWAHQKKVSFSYHHKKLILKNYWTKRERERDRDRQQNMVFSSSAAFLLFGTIKPWQCTLLFSMIGHGESHHLGSITFGVSIYL